MDRLSTAKPMIFLDKFASAGLALLGPARRFAAHQQQIFA
jgi:hypothetical protein